MNKYNKMWREGVETAGKTSYQKNLQHRVHNPCFFIEVPFDATPAKKGVPVVVEPFQTATGVDADCLRGRLYWSDTTGRAIKRAGYDGAAPEVFLRRGPVGFPEGLAVDWVARNLYWTDSGKRTIEVASLDERVTVVVTLVDEGLMNPRGIAVHPALGRLFWTDWDRAGPRDPIQ